MPHASAPSDNSAYDYGTRRSGETHGVVLTKPHIVSLILDLSGYTADRDLAQRRLLDPACGRGAFIAGAVERLLSSAQAFGHDLSRLGAALRAYDVDADHVQHTRHAVVRVLAAHGVPSKQAQGLAASWVQHADALLSKPAPYDYVVGNPPYVRIEQLDPKLQARYRQRFRTLYDRADLYVAFIEHGLSLLSEAGVLSFICADRWTLNKYGAPLRALITERFAVRYYVDMHGTSPFESDVIAYPSIFVFARDDRRTVQVAKLQTASARECQQLARALARPRPPARAGIASYDTWFERDQPWVLGSPTHLRTLRALEQAFAPIESSARVGIGVATGNDRIYIVDGNTDIEPSRLVPLIMRSDLTGAPPQPPLRYVINTFEQDGSLVDLDRYPRLRRYLLQHAAAIRRRHIARRAPASWYRTIDRVYPELVHTPKLLIPDIAGSNSVVYDRGHYHPHHNLYFVTSERWDMEVLAGLLSSRVALFFVWSYAVKMRGGYLRFQAQYLRRIRLPEPETLARPLARGLQQAFRDRDFQRLDTLSLRAYGLTELPRFDFFDARR